MSSELAFRPAALLFVYSHLRRVGRQNRLAVRHLKSARKKEMQSDIPYEFAVDLSARTWRMRETVGYILGAGDHICLVVSQLEHTAQEKS